MNKLAQTLQPFQIVVGKEPFTATTSRLDQALALIDPKGAGMNIE